MTAMTLMTMNRRASLKGGAPPLLEMRDGVMGREHRQHKCDKARYQSEAHYGFSSSTTRSG
jgi:hypothetical protein